MSRIIILNGPIGCGKDTIGETFAGREGYEFTSFKEPMFRIAASTMGYGYDEFLSMYQNREWKESPNERLSGRTVRELMIHISEVYVKPFLGQDYFGQQALNYINLRPWQHEFIFGDGGFPMEINVLAEAGHEVILVHMYRDGCTFEGDSRAYVLTNSVPRIHTLTNNGTVDEAVDELGRIIDYYDDQRNQSRTEDADDSDDVSESYDQPVARQRVTARHSSRRNGSTVAGQSLADVIRRAQQGIRAEPVQAGFNWTDEGEPNLAARAEAAIDSRGSAVSGTQTVRDNGVASGWYTASGEPFILRPEPFTVMDEVESMSEGEPGQAI